MTDVVSYEYVALRPMIFTDDGQRLFLRVRDATLARVRQTGAIRMREAIANHVGDVWELMACVDRMVEIGELVEIAPGRFSGDKRVFALSL